MSVTSLLVAGLLGVSGIAQSELKSSPTSPTRVVPVGKVSVADASGHVITEAEANSNKRHVKQYMVGFFAR